MLFDKGVQEFVDAATIIKNKGIKATFLLAGEIDKGNPKAVAESLLADWHNQGVIEWLGFQTDMALLMNQSDIICLPSYREGLPKSLIEALAVGKPVVTTDVPGCREVVQHGLNGLLVPAKNTQELATALELLITNQPLRQQMGEHSRIMAEQEFSIESVVNKTTAIYHRLLTNS
jgi:glycosyltransferase involved in cell wall biosynthesis